MAKDELLQGKYVIGKSSVVGDARRKWEDRVYASEIKRDHGDPLVVGIVADGVGSADIGSRGAQLAVDTVVAELTHSQGNDIPELIEHAIRAANTVVYNENQKNEKEAWTTLVVAVMYGNRCFIGNVGDSRAYWAQEDGTFLQLTNDHTFYNIYGGDPNAENAGAVVNTIGVKSQTQVDPGFYLKPDMTKEQAHRIGYAGLPLKPGEAIVLCSDGLIKVDDQNKRYAKDEEIINALQTEYEQDKAAIKMVGVAEGRRPTDNVSAVTIQCLTSDIIKQRQSRSAQAARMRMLRNVGAGVISLSMLAAIGVLGFFLLQKPRSITTTVVITLTPEPTSAPTATIIPGQGRVEAVHGDGANVTAEQMLAPNAKMIASDKGVKVVVGEQSTVGENTAGVMFWFGDSAGNVNFDARHMMPLLETGALYVRPGTNKAEVHLDQEEAGMMASVEGSQMIVERVENDIMVYCFEGKCRLDPGAGLDELKIEVGYKRLYRTTVKKADDPVEMTYDEKWAWNEKCYRCMFDIIATPTPTAGSGGEDGGPTQTRDSNNNSSSATPKQPTKTKIIPTTKVPGATTVVPKATTAVPKATTAVPKATTDVPPTHEPPTNEPPTNEPPTNEPPTNEPPTNEPPTKEPPTKEPPTKEPPTHEPPTNEPPTSESPEGGGNSGGGFASAPLNQNSADYRELAFGYKSSPNMLSHVLYWF